MTASDSGGSDIRGELSSLDAGVRAVREKLEEEAVKRDERIRKSDEATAAAHNAARFAKRVAIGAVVVALIAIGTAWSSSSSAGDANNRAGRAERALAAYKTATQEARVGSCQQYNRHERDQAAIEVGESHDQIGLFVAAAPAGTDPAKVVMFVEDYNRQHDRKIRAVHEDALRDCTPAGIERFLRGIPTK